MEISLPVSPFLFSVVRYPGMTGAACEQLLWHEESLSRNQTDSSIRKIVVL